jgi:hypothetical protein
MSYREIVFPCLGYELIVSKLYAMKKCLQLSDCIIVDFLGESIFSSIIKKIISKKNNHIVKIQVGLIPSYPRTRKFFISKIFRYLRVIVNISIKWVFGLRDSVDTLFLGGLAGENTASAKIAKNKVSLFSFDYDLFLKSDAFNSRGRLIEGEYNVFLDEDFIFHTDFEHLGITVPKSLLNYYEELNCFFDLIEKESEIPVVWCLHPRSVISRVEPLLGGRRFFQHETIELVKNCRSVFLHQSTSISFPVIYKKAMIFLTSNGIDDTWFGKNIEYLAGMFERRPLCINDAPENFQSYTTDPNSNSYEFFFHSYIKMPDAPDIRYWEFFKNYFYGKRENKI